MTTAAATATGVPMELQQQQQHPRPQAAADSRAMATPQLSMNLIPTALLTEVTTAALTTAESAAATRPLTPPSGGFSGASGASPPWTWPRRSTARRRGTDGAQGGGRTGARQRYKGRRKQGEIPTLCDEKEIKSTGSLTKIKMYLF